MPKDIIFTEREVVKAMGYTMDCESPLEISNEHGSATGDAASELINKYRKRMLKVYKANMMDTGAFELDHPFVDYTCATCKEAISTNCDFLFAPENIERYCVVEGCKI